MLGLATFVFLFRNRKVITKSLCDTDFAELLGEHPGAICIQTLVLLVMPSNFSDNSLALFVR